MLADERKISAFPHPIERAFLNKLDAMNQKNVGDGRALAYPFESRVLRRVIKRFGLLDARNLEDDEALRLPVTL